MSRPSILLLAAAACSSPASPLTPAATPDTQLTARSVPAAKPAPPPVDPVVTPPDVVQIADASFTLQAQAGHSGEVKVVAMSPDGNLVATGGDDALVALWDARSGKLVRIYAGHRDDVTNLRFSRDGKSLLSNGNDDLSFLWDVSRAKSRFQYDSQLGMYHGSWDVDASDDARFVAFTINGNPFSLERAPRRAVVVEFGKRIIELPRHLGRVNSVALSDDSRQAVTTTSKGEAIVWDLATRQRVYELHRGIWSSGELDEARFVHGTTKIMVRSDDGDIYVFDTGGGRHVQVKSPIEWLDAARVLPDGTIEVWADGKEERGMRPMRLFAWGPDGTRIPAPAGAPSAQVRGAYQAGFEHDDDIKTTAAFAAKARRSVTLVGERVIIWDNVAGVRLNQFAVKRYGRAGRVEAAALDPAGKRALLSLYGSVVELDLTTMSRTQIDDDGADLIAYCGDGKRAVLVSSSLSGGSQLRVVELATQKQLASATVKGHVLGVAMSAGCDRVVASSMAVRSATTLSLIDAATGNLIRTRLLPATMFMWGMGGSRFGHHVLRNGDGDFAMYAQDDSLLARFAGDLDRLGSKVTSTDGRYVARRDDAQGLVVTEVATGAEQQYHVLASSSTVAFSPDGTSVLAFGLRLHRWRIADDSVTTSALGPKVAAVTPDGKQVASVKDAEIRLHPLGSATARRFAGHSADVGQVSFAANAPRMLSTSDDGTMRLWKLDTSESLAIMLLGYDWIAYTPDGLFTSSLNGTDLVAMVRGNRAFGIEQFAVQSNRPDLILKRFELGDDARIAGFARRVGRRLAKAGLDPAAMKGSLELPDATITAVDVNGSKAEITVRLSAGDVGLAGYQVYVNGVPAAARPWSAEGREVTTKATVTLTSGRNQIEVGAFNRSGTESFRALRTVNVPGSAPRDLYFVGFGVSSYKDSELDLELAHKDANDLAWLFWNLRGHGFREAHVTTFENQEVSLAAFGEAAEFLEPARPEDTVIIFISGHGVLDPGSGRYFYLGHEADTDDLPGTAIGYEVIEALLARVGARKKLLLMDTCDSGELDDEARVAVGKTAGSKGLRSRGVRLFDLKESASAPAAIRVRLDRERFIFRDVFRRTGAVVISSSRGGELSYESKEIGNGLFTAELLAALTTTAADKDGDGAVSRQELRDYLVVAVAERSGDLQHPTIDRDNLLADFAFPITSPPEAVPEPGPPPAAPTPAAVRSRRGCGCDGGQGPAGGWLLLVAVLFAVARPATRR